MLGGPQLKPPQSPQAPALPLAPILKPHDRCAPLRLALLALILTARASQGHSAGPPPLPLPLAPPSPLGYRTVPGTGSADEQVTEIVLPSDYEFTHLAGNGSHHHQAQRTSYVIENKRYVEAVSSRCLVSTALEDPKAVEPAFVIIRPNSEVRLNATAPTELIKQANYDPSLPTTIIVHGFTQSYPDTVWLRKSRALFERNSMLERENLIIMDWRIGAAGSYGQVAARASGMGSFLANFITKLLELGADRLQIHLVGHSLGAHVAGFAGKRIRPRIGRITALDAAGPCFGKLLLNSPSDRLSPDDAHQVAVYHYDDDFLGLPGQQGQFDIYVNGGSQQPGCKGNVNTMLNFLLTTLFRLNRVLSESHTRSTEVSTFQLAQSGCQHVAYECPDYQAFARGECGQCDDQNSQCYLMSLPYQMSNAPRLPLRSSFPGKRLYISTGPSESQFCMLHYQILVRVELLPDFRGESVKLNKVRLHLDLTNDRFERFSAVLTNQVAPNVFSYLLMVDTIPARIKEASVQVRNSDGEVLEPLSGRLPARLHDIEVRYMSNIDPHVRRAMSSLLCPVPWPSGGITSFVRGDTNTIRDGPTNDLWTRFEECLGQPPLPPLRVAPIPQMEPRV